MAGYETTVLVRKSGLVFAVFAGVSAAIGQGAFWATVTGIACAYFAVNYFFCRIRLIPGWADFLTNLGFCFSLTIFNAAYSNLLFHTLIVTMMLTIEKHGIRYAPLLIAGAYVSAAGYAAKALTPDTVLSVAANLAGMYMLTYATLHVRKLLYKRSSDAKQMKELINQSNQHYRMALTDALTGLYNHRAYKEKAESIPQYVILVIDIDYFKRLNDTYGHAIGDKVLSKLGHIIRAGIRQGDFAFRYGGEEFVVLLPDADLALGYKIAERLRSWVAQSEFSFGTVRIPVTVSIGLAAKAAGTSAMAAFEQADEALYNAKQRGRNNVQSYGGNRFDDCRRIYSGF
ncbi:MAG: GGDEF domain-containing protein [Negativicutes bacterium]|nr:GGDEF domain-containing protein [Negativicutes bacterium]